MSKCEKCGLPHSYAITCTEYQRRRGIAMVTVETRHHFQCPDCGEQWSIGYWKPVKLICCPHCGEALEVVT